MRFLLDARRACEYSITTYHELVQVLNLRHARELGPDEAATRAARTLRSQPPLLDELAAQAAPERQPALVAAALALHGAEPLTSELLGRLDALVSDEHIEMAEEEGELPEGWPLHDGGGDGGLKFPTTSDALDEGGMQPPASWASEALGWDEAPTLMGEREAITREARGLRLVAAPLTRAAEEAALQADATMYVLGVRVAENGASGVIVEWRYPPGMASNQSAWVGLHTAATPRWIRAQERSKYKMISKNTAAGSVTFTPSETKHVRDGEYVFALWRDGCPPRHLAARDHQGRRGGGGRRPARDVPRGDGGHASALGVWRWAEADAGGVLGGGGGGRWRGGLLLPVPLIEVSVDGESENKPLLNRAYQVIDKQSYLDWGLTSDYDAKGGSVGGGGRRGRGGSGGGGNSGDGRTKEVHGLSGNTKGSEGYGEVTAGSLQRLSLLLAHLRVSVLCNLHGGRWARAWDLRSHSSLVDVGSGYGKCVLHFAVENQLRRAAGIECVISRHEIASQVMQELHGELLLRPSLAAPAAAASADGEGGATEEAGAADGAAEAADPYAAVSLHFGDATLGGRDPLHACVRLRSRLLAPHDARGRGDPDAVALLRLRRTARAPSGGRTASAACSRSPR